MMHAAALLADAIQALQSRDGEFTSNWCESVTISRQQWRAVVGRGRAVGRWLIKRTEMIGFWKHAKPRPPARLNSVL